VGETTEVKIRFEGEQAVKLRELALKCKGGYVALLRKWIEERLEQEIGDPPESL
jgi:hypothetical protein